MKQKAITQEHPMGCAVACVACVSGTNCKNALKLFDAKKEAVKGYYSKKWLKHC